MKVLDLVKRPPITCEPGCPLSNALKLMHENNVGSVLITEGGRIRGIFTERDLVRAVLEGAKLDDPVSKYMNPNPIKVYSDESLESAIRKMLEHGLRHLPVIDSTGYVKGIISIKDIAEVLYEGCNPP